LQPGRNAGRSIFLEALMNRLLAALLFIVFLPGSAPALEIKNLRPCYGPFGATRYDAKCLPGDVLFMTYDIEGLTTDKDGKVSYETILELLDVSDPDPKKAKVLFKTPTANEMIPALGGKRMPGDLHVKMGAKQAAGKYAVRLTITDKFDKNENTKYKAIRYDFAVIQETFGLIQVSAPTVGFPGLPYETSFGLVNMKLDKKNQPDVVLTISILDEKKKAVAEPEKIVFPRDMPAGTDLTKFNLVPWRYPLYLNRPGRFTVEVLANDKIGNTTYELRYPLTVLDLSAIAK
jgi:hypothetical protein